MDNSGKFRGCWMFDTHEAKYYLNDDWTIVGIECNKFSDALIWVTTWSIADWFIGNPWIFALSAAESDDVSSILTELTVTYSGRIQKWLDPYWEQQKAA